MTSSRCVECFCIPQECSKNISCIICNKESYCTDGHAKQTTKSPLLQFFRYAKGLYAAALGIAAAYAIGCALAGLATFITILGRFNGEVICGCCSLLEQNARKGFVPNLKGTMWDFVTGVDRLWHLHRQPNLKTILKSSVVILARLKVRAY